MVNALKNMYFMCSINEVMLPRMLHLAKLNPPTIISSSSKYFTNHIIIFRAQTLVFLKVRRITTNQFHYFRSIYNYNIVMNCHHCMANSRKRQFRSFQKTKISRTDPILNPNWHEAGHFYPPCNFRIGFCQLNLYQTFLEVKIDINWVDLTYRQAQLVL